jgi:hypothetical protein
MIATLALAVIAECRGALVVLRQRGAEEHGGGVHDGRAGRMNWKRMVGLDTLEEEYAFASSDATGYTSAKKIPDHWVPTTCGYCSVGCGIELGVKDGKAIASRPLAAHPVNRGKLCPKGLSEHYIIDVENRPSIRCCARTASSSASIGKKRWARWWRSSGQRRPNMAPPRWEC